MASPSVETVLEFLEQLEVPAIEIDISRPTPVINRLNDAFVQEFDTNGNLSGSSVTAIIDTDPETPIKRVPRQPTALNETVELDLLEHDSTTYLRQRAWASDRRLIDLYIDAGSDLPHHQHIAVLHRVFRHNLRNSVNAITGWANYLSERTDDPQMEAAASTIVDRATDLARISDEARRLENLLHTDTELRPVNLRQLVLDVVDDCECRFDSPLINVDVPPDVIVIGNEKLRFVVDNLIDNAFRHNDLSTTTVDVVATELDDDRVELLISDSGSGLPPMEQKVVTGDLEIDQLNHGNGLGLWLVRWILDTHYATVDVSTSADTGTTYQIHLLQ